MRKALGLTLSGVAMLLALPSTARTAFAHGGQYRGPAGEVPPDSRQPEDPPPPDTGPNTPTPPDTGPDTPTPPDSGPDTPTPPPTGTPDNPGDGPGPVPPPGTGPGPGQTGTRRPTVKKGPSYESWLFWWNYNKDEILKLKQALRSGGGSSSGNLADMAQSGEAVGGEQNVTAKIVESRVVPLLKSIAEDSKLHFDIQASGVMSLAKIGRREAVPLLMKMAANRGPEQYHKVVEETAALSLGVMQDRSPAVREFLGARALDAAAKTRTRCFAAFALGLLGEPAAAPGSDPSSYAVLKSLVTNPGESSGDLASSALVAIGHLGDPAAVPDLLSWLAEEKAGGNRLTDIQLSCVAAALGKIGRPGLAGPGSREVLDGLIEQMKRKHRTTRYSVVIALGQVAPRADERLQKECVGWLCDIVGAEGRPGTDAQTVNFALASLGRIAGSVPAADGTVGCPEPVRSRAMDRLLQSLESSRPTTRSFAALSLGVATMNLPESVRAKTAETVARSLGLLGGDVEVRGAHCISLGLMRSIRSAPQLQLILQDRGIDRALRGAAAVGLGLIGDSGALEPVRAALREKNDRELRVDAAVAAGLLHDNSAVPMLVGILREPKSSQFILGSVASALGRIGDQRAVEPLIEIVTDARSPELTRALACTALGQIGDRSDVAVLSRVSRDVNYRAYYDAIGELLTIL